MGVEEEVLQLTYQVKGIEQGQALEAQLERLRDARGRFVAAEEKGAASDAQAEAATRKLEAATYELADSYEVLGAEQAGVFTSAQKVGPAMAAIAAAQDRIGSTPLGAKLGQTSDALDRVDGAGKRAKGGVAGFGQSMLQSGRIVQDFAQGGIGGILNNIEGFVQAIGLGSGAAGALTILGVGFMVLKPQIADFMKSLNVGGVKDFVSQIDALNARIKEIEDKPHKLTVDVQDLQVAQAQVDQIKAALSAVDKLTKGQAHYEKESGAAIGEMFAEAPGGAQGVRDALRGQLEPEVMARATAPIAAQEKAKQEELDRANRLALSERDPARLAAMDTNIERIKGELDRLKEKRLAAVTDVLAPGKGQLDVEVGNVLDRAQNGAGPEQAGAQGRLAELLKKSGRGDLARGVEAASPRQHQLNDQIDDELETQLDGMKAARKSREETAKKRDAADKKALADVQAFLDKEFDRDLDELKDASKAAKAAGKGDAKDAKTDAKAAEKAGEDAVKAQLGKVRASVGDPYRQRFEAAMARNALANAQGGGIDPAEMERRLRLEMAAALRKRGASPEVAQRATSEIADKGNADLAKRMAQLNNAQGSNQEKLITLAAGLSGEMARAVQVQQRHGQAINALMQGQQARQRTGRSRGRGG